MKRSAKWVVFISILALLAGFLMVGPVMVMAEGEGEAGEQAVQAEATPTGMENKGSISAIVWDDTINPDGSFPALEGVNGIKVELYRYDGKDASGNAIWTYYDSQVTYGSVLQTGNLLYGYVSWSGLPVKTDGTTTYYKLTLVDDTGDTFKIVNQQTIGGTNPARPVTDATLERLAGLASTNLYIRNFINTGGELASFQIDYLKPWPTVNKGIVETLVWDDAVKADVTDPRQEGVDGIIVNLYGKDENGDWVLLRSMKSGWGGFVWGSEHGWAGWNDLPVVPQDNIRTPYKLQIVSDDTFNIVGESENEFTLDFSNQWYLRFFEVSENSATRAFRIQSNAVVISGTVWHDINANLYWEGAIMEPPQEGWTVLLTDKYGRKVATTKTNSHGYYQFKVLKPGVYKIWVYNKFGWKQVAPYYKLCTIPPWGYEKGHYVVATETGKYYINNNFGVLYMFNSLFTYLYYGLWWIGLMAYQFE